MTKAGARPKHRSQPQWRRFDAAAAFLDRLSRRRRTGLAVAGLYTLVIAMAGLKYHIVGDGDAESDFFGAYVVQARSFLAGDIVIDHFRGPLYPIVLALLGAVLKPLGAGLFETGIVLSALSAGVAILLFHRLASALFSPPTGLAAALLVALNPVFMRYGYTASTDMFFVALAMAATILTLGTTELQWGRAVALGVALALAYLTRYNGATLLAAAVVAIVFLDAWNEGWQRRLAAGGVVLAVFFVFIVPWGMYCQAEKGPFFYNLNYRNVVLALLPEGFTGDYFDGVDLRTIDGFLDVFRAFPGQLLASLPERAWDQFAGGLGQVLRWPVGVAVILGFAGVVTTRPTRRQLGYYLFGFFLFLSLLLVFFNQRFGLYLIPVCAVVAVAGLSRVALRLGDGVRARAVAATVVSAALCYSAVASIGYNRGMIAGVNPEIHDMVALFRQAVPPHEQTGRVVARKPDFSYFAGLDPLPLPFVRTHEELLEYLWSRDADYLFFSSLAWRTRPELSYLADFEKKHRGLTLVFRHDAALLYQVDER